MRRRIANPSDQDDLIERVAYWSGVTGKVPTELSIKPMKKKWGQCSVSGHITLSSDLIEMPAAFQDYVVVHELLHLHIHDHGRLFKALLSAYLPGWKSAAMLGAGKATE